MKIQSRFIFAVISVGLFVALGYWIFGPSGKAKDLRDLVRVGDSQVNVRRVLGRPRASGRYPSPPIAGAPTTDHWYYGPLFELKRNSNFPYLFRVRPEIFQRATSPGWLIHFDTNGLVAEIHPPKNEKRVRIWNHSQELVDFAIARARAGVQR